MKLLVKQRAFSWTDSYDVYDENENAKYFVKAEFLSLGHRLHVYDMAGNELGLIKEKVMSLLPVFEIEVNGQPLGRIEKRFTLFRPKYDVEFNGWHVEGDFMGWNYDIYEACSPVVHISKELLHWGDTYVLDFANPAGLRPRRICFFTGEGVPGSGIGCCWPAAKAQQIKCLLRQRSSPGSWRAATEGRSNRWKPKIRLKDLHAEQA